RRVVLVRAGLVLVDLPTALPGPVLALGVARLVLAVTRLVLAVARLALTAGLLAAASRHAGRGAMLALIVALLRAVVVLRVRVVLGAVRLAHVAVVRSRTRDRDRHVDVRLLRARFARSRLFCAVFVRRRLRLLDQLADGAAVSARERSARDHGERTDTRRHGHPWAFHANTAPFETSN